MNAVELFDEAQNGVVLKTSQKLCFENIIFGLSTSQLPWATFAGKKKFLGVVVYTLNKRWRRRKEEKLRNRILFSANTWGPGAKMLQSFEICSEDFEMYCEDFRICTEFKMCFEEVGIRCA